MGRIALNRVMTFALAGAAGGLLTWIVLNPSMSEFEEAQRQGLRLALPSGDTVGAIVSQVLRMGAMLGLTVGVALIAVEEAGSRNIRRFALYCLLGALVGAMCGVIGSVGGQILFSLMLGGAALTGGLNPIAVIVARTPGWALIGAATG